MALKSGLNASLGFATEGVVGTYQAPTRWVPLVSEGITQEIDRLESAGIIAGRRTLDTDQWAAGNKGVAGPIGLELYDRSIGMLFTHMFGAVATSGSGPYTHTFSPGDLTGKSLTVQVGKPNTTDGTVHPFSSAGCKVASWEIACRAGEIATLGLDIVGMSQTTAQALVTPAPVAGIGIGMTFVGGSITIGGSAYKTRGITLAGDNGLDPERRFIGQDTVDEPLEVARRVYSGEIDSELFSLTAYDRFVNGTTAILVAAFARGTSTCTITEKVRFDGTTPTVDGPGIVGQMLPFTAVGDVDFETISAVLVNSDSTP